MEGVTSGGKAGTGCWILAWLGWGDPVAPLQSARPLMVGGCGINVVKALGGNQSFPPRWEGSRFRLPAASPGLGGEAPSLFGMLSFPQGGEGALPPHCHRGRAAELQEGRCPAGAGQGGRRLAPLQPQGGSRERAGANHVRHPPGGCRLLMGRRSLMVPRSQAGQQAPRQDSAKDSASLACPGRGRGGYSSLPGVSCGQTFPCMRLSPSSSPRHPRLVQTRMGPL